MFFQSQTDLIVTTKSCRAKSMLSSKVGISAILLYSLCNCTIAHTATLTLGAFYQYRVLLKSSYTSTVYRFASLLTRLQDAW